MSHTVDNSELQITPEDIMDFKRALLATVFNESHAELLLYQKGRCLKIAKANRIKKVSKPPATADNNESMPNVKVLDDIKFDRELDALRNIYKVAYESLTTEGLDPENPYLELQKTIEAQNESTTEIDVLTNELGENKSILKNLKELQIKKQSELTEKLAQKKQRVKDLRDQLNNIKRINRLELRLVEKWEDNRLSQATIVGEKEERFLMQKILDFNRRIAGEQRLICEIETFRNNEISELKIKIADWEKKFKEDKTKIVMENSTLAQNIASIVKSHDKHRQIMEQRDIFVAEYLRQKYEEQRLYKEQCYRIECSIRIQAWWRGVMVRRGLGPYRKKSKKGKKHKPKNK